MKRVLTAVILIPLVLADIFFAPDWLVVLTVGLVATLAASEFLQLAEASGMAPYRGVTVSLVAVGFATMALFLARNRYADDAIALLTIGGIFFIPLVFLLLGLSKPELREALPAAAVSYFTFYYIAFPLACLVAIRRMEGGGPQADGRALLAIVLIVTWVGDIAAMYAGRAFGKHKLAPRISPGKTIEGSVASLVFAVIVCWALVQYALPRYLGEAETNVPTWVPIVLGVGLNIAAQLGDLAESAIKRGAGVKDSGTLLPGHGGVLDRIDALLLAAPVGMLILLLTRDYFSR
ncbi:MAG: phosphatidate cytidylyltransferase [Acidobacteriota bacterium]|nr:phosphatidate cytidylyltransferase [Acidobacteriota bacterium]